MCEIAVRFRLLRYKGLWIVDHDPKKRGREGFCNGIFINLDCRYSRA